MIRYARCDGGQLAYEIHGDGPVDLVLVTEWVTPLEGRWDVPALAGRLERLGQFARVISFDKRGVGLSDRSDLELAATPELWVRDLVAVLDAVGAERPVVFGAHDGGPISLLYAASLPERTEALVLANTGARITDSPDHPFGHPTSAWQPDLDGIVAVWRDGLDVEGHIAAAATDPWWRSWYARVRRSQVGPTTGWRLMQMLGGIDVRHVLDAVVAPTLVVHRTDNPWWDVRQARWMADRLPDARLVELPGSDNLWWAGDADPVVDAVEQFVTGERRSVSRTRELATLAFTDLVRSTERASSLGDDAWRQLLDAHDRVTAAEVARHGGTVVKHLGDGLLMTFEGPARALHAMVAVRDALANLDLPIRAAVHTGEVERRGDDLGGVAVHLAARVMGEAEAGEILTTAVVRGLVAGSGLRFVPRGTHRLKGLDDPWELVALDA